MSGQHALNERNRSEAEIESLKGRLAKLVQAAKRIAWHKPNCAIILGFNNPCGCGFEDLQTAIKEAE